MKAKKDYGSKAIRWKKRKEKIKFLIKLGIPSLLLLIILLLFVFDFTVLRDNTLRTSLLKGDIVLLNKLTYGPYSLNNIPFTDVTFFSARLFNISEPDIGDIVAVQEFYYDSLNNNEYVHNHFKRCIGRPGDAFSITDTALLVNGFPTYLDVSETPDSLVDSLDFEMVNLQKTLGNERFQDVTIPGAGVDVFLTPENYLFWKPLIEAENPGFVISSENEKVFINGNKTTSYTFRNDFFVVTGFSQYSGYDKILWNIVPFENITGRAEFVCFSYGEFDNIQNIQDFFGRFRWGRIFKSAK